MNIGYVRVSTISQHEDRQIKALEPYNIEKTFIEKVSAKDMNRQELQNMIDFSREGDIIYIESFSRLARNVKDLLSIVDILQSKNVQIISLKEKLDTQTSTGKLMLTLIGAISEFERDIMLERQREGIELAKIKGKYKGRQKKKKPSNWLELKEQYQSRKITATTLAKKCGVSRPIIYKWIKE